MLEDLEKDIDTAVEKGERIIIGGDLNSETTQSPWPEMMEKFALRDIIRETHSNRNPARGPWGELRSTQYWPHTAFK